jgi:general secretion pathway protein K
MDRQGQQGAALILAILVTALIAVLAIGAGSEHMITLKRASNQLLTEKAYGYLRGAEAMTLHFLDQDAQRPGGDTVDSCDESRLEPLSLPPSPLLIDEGDYWLALEDLAGRFNLNKLVSTAKGTSLSYDVHQQRFIRLLQSFVLPSTQSQITYADAERITEALIDWGDADENPTGGGGAEDGIYDSREPPFRTPNRPFYSVSELLLVEGMTPELYQVIQHHVTVWPLDGTGSINVNTATPNVLRSLNVYQPAGGSGTGGSGTGGTGTSGSGSNQSDPPLDEASGPLLAALQKGEGFTDVAAFVAATASIYSGTLIEDGLDVKSDSYLLKSLVNLGDYQATSYSVIDRRNRSGSAGGAIGKVIARSQSGFELTNWCQQ